MSYSNDIKSLLGIKDDSIHITNVEIHIEDKREVKVVHGLLTAEPSHCPICGGVAFVFDEKMIVKNGTKKSKILLGHSSFGKTILYLKKQRFHCKQCFGHFTCKTPLVDRYCFISKQIKFSILEALSNSQSASLIARNHSVSWSTVQCVIQSLRSSIKRKREWLPSCLMVDEFRSLKNMDGKMSFICADGNTGELFDVLPSRRLNEVVAYFNQFTRAARKSVRYLVMDMNAPYFELIKKCFPNAKIIVDRFHIVQHMNRQFDKVRVRIMKTLDQNDPVQGCQYRQLKSLFRLLLKRNNTVDHSTLNKWRNFKWSLLTEADVIHRLLSISSELKIAYDYYQNMIHAFKESKTHIFYKLIKHMPEILPFEIKHLRKAFFKYIEGIWLAMKRKYSNGKIENKNTHIKTLKRICYGFKNFQNMKVRIFLQNHLIKFN